MRLATGDRQERVGRARRCCRRSTRSWRCRSNRRPKCTTTTGSSIARADLHVLGTPFVHEYDGEHHRRRTQQKVDLRRDAAGGSSYVRKGFVLDDLLNHPAVVMHEIDNALGRPTTSDRLRRWKRLVEQLAVLRAPAGTG